MASSQIRTMARTFMKMEMDENRTLKGLIAETISDLEMALSYIEAEKAPPSRSELSEKTKVIFDKVEQLENQINEEQKQNESMQQQIVAMKEQDVEKIATIKRIEKEKEDMTAMHQSTIDAHRELVADKDTKTKQLENEIVKLQSQIEEASQRHDDLQREIESMRQQIVMRQSTIEAHRKLVADLNARIKEKDTKTGGLQNEIDKLRSQIEGANQLKEELDNEIVIFKRREKRQKEKLERIRKSESQLGKRLKKRDKKLKETLEAERKLRLEIGDLRVEEEAKRKELEEKLKKELEEARKLKLQNKVDELQAQAVGIVASVSKQSKNELLKQARENLSELKATRAEGESGASNLVEWAGSCISEDYPHVSSGLMIYVGTVNYADWYLDFDECTSQYQMVRASVLGVSMLFITAMGLKTAAASISNLSQFVAEFWKNWLVFLFLVMVSMGLPPLECYGDYMSQLATVWGAVGLVAMVFCGEVSKWRKNKKARAEDEANGGNAADSNAEGDALLPPQHEEP